MSSIYPANFREIDSRVSEKFDVARFFMGTTIVVPIYSFIEAKRGVALPVFGSYLP